MRTVTDRFCPPPYWRCGTKSARGRQRREASPSERRQGVHITRAAPSQPPLLRAANAMAPSTRRAGYAVGCARPPPCPHAWLPSRPLKHRDMKNWAHRGRPCMTLPSSALRHARAGAAIDHPIHRNCRQPTPHAGASELPLTDHTHAALLPESDRCFSGWHTRIPTASAHLRQRIPSSIGSRTPSDDKATRQAACVAVCESVAQSF